MSTLNYKLSYKRNLPHIQPEGATLFITFRLHRTIPQTLLRQWQEEKARFENALIADSLADRQRKLYEKQRRQFGRIDAYLDSAKHGPTWLRDKRIAQAIVDALHYRDAKVFRLDAYCLMSNHGHIVIYTPAKRGWKLSSSIKNYALAKAPHSCRS